MTDTITFRVRNCVDGSLRRPMALIEAIEVEELIVIPGVDALLDDPHEFGLSFDSSIALSGLLRKHAHRVGVLKRMAAEELTEKDCSRETLDQIPAALPVRAVRFIASQPKWAADRRGIEIVRIAFSFVAVHALTDPTNCHTASRALHLRPRPLHDDRELLRTVLGEAMPGLDGHASQLLATYISKASAFFADPDDVRWSTPFRGDTHPPRASASLLDYNPDALSAACRSIGLDATGLRIAPRKVR